MVFSEFETRPMKIFIILTTYTLLCSTTICAQKIQKCDTKVLIPISKNLGTAKQSEIRDFLMTFGKECRNNVEFSEWSNEILFDLLDKQTELTLQTIVVEGKKIEKSEVIKVLSSPLLDRVDAKKLKERIKKLEFDPALKREIIEALKAAEGKQ